MAGSGTDWGAAFSGGGSSSGGGTDWGSAFGGFKPAKSDSGGGGGGILGSIAHALGSAGSAIANVGEGIGGTVLDVGKAFYVLPDEMMSGKNEAQRMADYNERIPFLAALGWGGKQGGSGLAQTIGEAGGKSLLGPVVGKKVVPTSQAYGDNPFSAALNDVANVTMLAGPAAAATGALAGGGNEARLAAIAAGTETPGVLGRTAGALQAVADAPGLPLRGAKSVLVNAGEKAIASGTENPGLLARLGTRLTPAYKDIVGTTLEGNAQNRAVSSIINQATSNEDAMVGLRSAGYHDAADAIDALRHTAAPPPVMSDNFAKVTDERANPPIPNPTQVPNAAPAADVSRGEVATALHNAGFHDIGNQFSKLDIAAPVGSRADVVAGLRAKGLGKAADLLEANVPKPAAGEDVLAGLRQLRTEKLTGIPAEAPAPRAPVAPKINEAPVEVPAKQAAGAAIGAVKSNTATKLEALPSVLSEHQPGAVSLEKVTNGELPAQGYLPPSLAKAVSPRFTSPADVHGSSLLGAMDPANHLYAQARLNLNPATLTGRLFGHTSLVGLNAPHPLDSLLNAVKVFTGHTGPEADQIITEAPARLAKSGSIPTFQSQLAEDVANKPGLAARATSKLDQLASKSPITRWASKMDDSLRKGIYLAERNGGAGAQEALNTVNRVAGEFDALSPAEQAIGRRLAPFYNWHKQIALIGTHLAEDNPAKAALLTHLGDVGEQLGNQPGGTPGELQIAGHAISPDFLIPFGEAGTTFKNLGTPSLGPIPKAVYGLTGQNPNTGKPFSGPNAKKGQDYRYEGIAQNLRKSIPQMGLVDNLRGYNDVARYNSGDPVVSHGQPIRTNTSPVDAGLSFAGLRSENLKSAQSRQAAVAAKAKKQAGGAKSSGGATDWGAAFGR